MDDLLNFDTAAHERLGALRFTRPARPRVAVRDRQELAAGEPIDIYHWAAVALVTALMCAVLGYAAGTPALSRAANITSLVFGAVGCALTASGIVRKWRTRGSLGGAIAETN